MLEIFALFSAGYSELQIKNMMKISNEVWYQYKRRFAKYLSNLSKDNKLNPEPSQSMPTMPEGYAPVNPLMYDKNLGTDQSRVINELVSAKILDRARAYELKKLFKPIGDDSFTRKAVEILAHKCRDLNLPWHVSNELGWHLRRKIARMFNKNIAEQLATDVLNQYLRRNKDW